MWSDDELTGDEVLGHHAWTGGEGRGEDGDGGPGGVRCGHPLIYPVPPEDLPTPLRGRTAMGHRYVGALFAFDLDPVRGSTGARFEVALTGPGCRAVRLDADGDSFGLVPSGPGSAVAARTAAVARPGLLRRLAMRRGGPRVWTTGAQSATFGWGYEDRRGALPRAYAMHALLEIPADATEVSGSLSVQVAGAGEVTGVPFTEPLRPVAENAAAVRLCMAADVVGYSRRGNAETEVLQHDLVRILGDARRAAGIGDGRVRPQPAGDGQFTVLPVGIDESAVIPVLLRELGERLAERDRGRAAAEAMRLRVALHRGLVKEAPNGWVGAAAIAVHRLLDSPPLRAAIGDNPAATYVLGLPDVLYRDVIVPGVQPPAEDFREMTVDLPEKGFVERGWLYLGPAVFTATPPSR
ncbi:hypothetical protein [Actinoplanes utahensis]|uniref:hypothetical protein n=1 Tax=Actinoplanes utahensis TaxID=1869 RepID=UPI00068D8139|nr:hypothetical protein [Actinoplanes utahensis]GIF33308.1 hypothetical protein Aut01nite_62940 [Actinoplanes utahensis]